MDRKDIFIKIVHFSVIKYQVQEIIILMIQFKNCIKPEEIGKCG